MSQNDRFYKILVDHIVSSLRNRGYGVDEEFDRLTGSYYVMDITKGLRYCRIYLWTDGMFYMSVPHRFQADDDTCYYNLCIGDPNLIGTIVAMIEKLRTQPIVPSLHCNP